MESYRNNLRVRVLGKLGQTALPTDVKLLKPIDEAILMEAEERLNDAEWLAFFYAYHCIPSWYEIQVILVERHGKKRLQLPTLEQYGRRACENILLRFDQIRVRLDGRF